jgi:hypothetical protein
MTEIHNHNSQEEMRLPQSQMLHQTKIKLIKKMMMTIKMKRSQEMKKMMMTIKMKRSQEMRVQSPATKRLD